MNKEEFDLSEKLIPDFNDLKVMERDIKEFIKQAEDKSDDAGHFQHDTKVVRIKDLQELAGRQLVDET